MTLNIIINKETGCVIKDEYISEEVMQMKNFMSKELLDFSTTESPKDKISESDPNLERSMSFCQ